MNTELIITLIEEKIEKLLNEVDELMKVKKEFHNSVPKIPSQDYSFQLDFTDMIGDSSNSDKHSKHYYDIGRNKTYDEMISQGYYMTDDGFWMKVSDSCKTG